MEYLVAGVVILAVVGTIAYKVVSNKTPHGPRPDFTGSTTRPGKSEEK